LKRRVSVEVEWPARRFVTKFSFIAINGVYIPR
jgi:hypothetical protein